MPDFRQVIKGMNDLLSTAEAASLLNIDQTSITRLLRQGKLMGRKAGGVWLVYQNSIEEYIEKNKDKAKNDPTRGKNG